jgi:hypothetical protein
MVRRLLLILAFLIASQVSAFAAFSLTNTDNRVDVIGGTTVTYNAGGDPSIGTANASRIVVVAMGGRVSSSSPVVSVSINGNAATHVSGASVTENTVMIADIWYLAVPTGTTATIAVTWPSNAFSSSIGVWSAIGSTGVPTVAVTASAATGPGAPAALSLPAMTVPVGGNALAMYGNRDWVAPSISWTNATLDYNVNASSVGGGEYTGAHTTATGSVTITCTDQDPVTQSSTEAVMVGAAFGPSTSQPSFLLLGVGG